MIAIGCKLSNLLENDFIIFLTEENHLEFVSVNCDRTGIDDNCYVGSFVSYKCKDGWDMDPESTHQHTFHNYYKSKNFISFFT
jgi:hypothetical protein